MYSACVKMTFLSSLVDPGSSSSEVQWCFSQVKGTLDDDVTEADIISCVEFNQDGDLLATGDKGGRVVIFQRDPQVGQVLCNGNKFYTSSYLQIKS